MVVHIYSEAETLQAEPDPLMDGDAPLPADPPQRPMNATLVYPDGIREPAECRPAAGSEAPVAEQDSPTETEPEPELKVQVEVDGEGCESAPAPQVPNPPPGILVGFGAMPAPLIAALITNGANVRHLTPPGTDPENRYRPSTALEEWIKARDLTCRFPHCDRPAQFCEFDHTTPWPAGSTHASGGKMYCKLNHFGKTFWAGWTDSQAADGTITITTPTGRTYAGKPASRLYFPQINPKSAPVNTPAPTPTPPGKSDHIPKYRKRNRARQRAYRINAERALNDAHVAEWNRPPPF